MFEICTNGESLKKSVCDDFTLLLMSPAPEPPWSELPFFLPLSFFIPSSILPSSTSVCLRFNNVLSCPLPPLCILLLLLLMLGGVWWCVCGLRRAGGNISGVCKVQPHMSCVCVEAVWGQTCPTPLLFFPERPPACHPFHNHHHHHHHQRHHHHYHHHHYQPCQNYQHHYHHYNSHTVVTAGSPFVCTVQYVGCCLRVIPLLWDSHL